MLYVRSKWQDEHNETVRRAFFFGARYDDIAETLNTQFGTNFNGQAVKNHARNTLGLRRPGPRPGVIWSRAMDDFLRHGVSERLTLTAISEALEIPYSAVVTRVRLLEIDIPQGQRRDPTLPTYAERRATELHRAARLSALLHWVPQEWRTEAPLPVTIDPVCDPLNLTLDEITRGQCHWITNDDMTAPRYCGHAALHGSWCKAHRAIVVA